MDVRINNVTSNIRMTDARAMLTPEVLAQIAEAVSAYMQREEQQRQEREQDMKIERRASQLDRVNGE
jgi:hypothetical protein